MKKLISMLLCVMLSIGTVMCMSSVTAFGAADTPIVYVEGQGSGIYRSAPNGSRQQVYPVSMEDGYITDAVNACLPYFKDAVLQGKWSAYREKLAEWMYPVFADMQLDKNGEPSDGSSITFDAETADPVNYLHHYGGGMYGYSFTHDWRLDPFESARRLNIYIEKVKAATGSAKVNLVGRCQGANVIMAYLAEYGYESVNCLELYVPSVKGVETVSAVFSGNIYFDADSLTRFIKDGKIIFDDFVFEIEDPVIMDFITQTLALSNDTYLLDISTAFLDITLVRTLYKEVVADMVMHSYGTFPGIWSLVTPNDFEAAYNALLKGKESEYPGLAQKVKRYDERVRQVSDELLLEAKAHGVKIAVYAKYGDFKSLPISYYANYLSDEVSALGIVPDSSVNIRHGGSSLGATTAKVGTVLSGKQIKNAKYLSPDKKVDCSTCLFPDTTWVIKDCRHKVFPSCIHAFMMKFFASDGTMTVFSDESCPQYMKYIEPNTVQPMTEQDYREPEKKSTPKIQQIFESIKNFFRSFLALVKKLLNK